MIKFSDLQKKVQEEGFMGQTPTEVHKKNYSLYTELLNYAKQHGFTPLERSELYVDLGLNARLAAPSNPEEIKRRAIEEGYFGKNQSELSPATIATLRQWFKRSGQSPEEGFNSLKIKNTNPYLFNSIGEIVEYIKENGLEGHSPKQVYRHITEFTKGQTYGTKQLLDELGLKAHYSKK